MIAIAERVLARLYIATARRLARQNRYGWGGGAWMGDR